MPTETVLARTPVPRALWKDTDFDVIGECREEAEFAARDLVRERFGVSRDDARVTKTKHRRVRGQVWVFVRVEWDDPDDSWIALAAIKDAELEMAQSIGAVPRPKREGS